MISFPKIAEVRDVHFHQRHPATHNLKTFTFLGVLVGGKSLSPFSRSKPITHLTANDFFLIKDSNRYNSENHKLVVHFSAPPLCEKSNNACSPSLHQVFTGGPVAGRNISSYHSFFKPLIWYMPNVYYRIHMACLWPVVVLGGGGDGGGVTGEKAAKPRDRSLRMC